MHEYNSKEFENLILPSLSFLEDRGFIYKGMSEKNQTLLGRSCTLTWENSSIKRALTVKYIESKSHAPMGTLMIKIEQLGPPELDQDDYTTKSSREVDIPRLVELNGSYDDRVQQCVAIAKEQLNGGLNAVLLGKKWVATQFDWAGMK